MTTMTKFYIFNTALLVIAVLNYVRACRDKNPMRKRNGIILNAIAIVLLAIAYFIRFAE